MLRFEFSEVDNHFLKQTLILKAKGRSRSSQNGNESSLDDGRDDGGDDDGGDDDDDVGDVGVEADILGKEAEGDAGAPLITFLHTPVTE